MVTRRSTASARRAAHAEQVDTADVFLDQSGLWTSAPGAGRGLVRSVPVPGGLAPGTVWPLLMGPDLPARLADLIDSAAQPARGARLTPRTVALAELVAAVVTMARGLVLPVPTTDGARWVGCPDPDTRTALDAATARAVNAFLVLADEPGQRIVQFADDLLAALLPAPDSCLAAMPSTPTMRRRAANWAEHVAIRAAANARIGLVLEPPTDTGGAMTPGDWTLKALAISLAESTTRLPVGTAAPDLLGAAPTAWLDWLTTESKVLNRAWGPALPELRDRLATWRTGYLTVRAVLEFVDSVAPRLAAAGFDVVAPSGLIRPAAVRRKMRSGVGGANSIAVDSLGLEPEILIDGEILTASEFAALAQSKSELVSIRGRWTRITADDAGRLAALARRLARPIAPHDLLADEAFDGIELATGDLLPTGLHPARTIEPPAGVHATLRHYQLAGLNWLTWLGDNQLGGVLADDMGLGKTLEVLAWIAADHPGPTLVVCPVTLVDTWLRQAAQFTPGLRVAAFHGNSRGEVADVAAEADVLITTYGLLAREPGLLGVPWHRVVLDEAQAIKNPDTRAARAARALPSAQRLVVTGTPVENHVGDLWSLLAFAQPGLLPRRKVFQKRFIGGVPTDLERLRAVVAPFILRRVKTDPGILPDLPDREVIRDDCTLTREQVGAYEAVVADMLGALEELRAAAAGRADDEPSTRKADPELMGRRAAVLGGIARLKQICVHPALLTESRRALASRSGKVERLVELCGQIIDEGQAVVVFTQFASFVPDLAAHLRATLGVEVLTLTGSDPRPRRAAVVAAFSGPDGPPILIASLKAGGTGLTLVRANHVIHLDRWWNPAVEDQASDRVWRIGQKQKVSVHVLVCPGTLEEQIDAALAAKREVAGAVIRSTESAITELSDADLAALVGLVRDRVLE